MANAAFKNVFATCSHESESVLVPHPLPVEGKPVQPQPESDSPPRILCGAFSPKGDRLVLCDDHKQMTLWQCSDRSLLRQWNLQGKRANSVTFNGDDEILEADKAGDVFKFSASAKDDDNGTLVLGHLSMLIDLAITPCGKYVITADRDEKIRVSNYPNAFSIHSFCLGHTEFITSLALVSSSPDLLLSSSGDGTVKCWDFKAGKEHSSRLCYEDAGMSLMEEQDEEEEQQNRGGGDEFWRKSRQTPAVKGITVHEYSSGETVVAVNVEGFRGVLIYSLDVAEKSKLKFVQKLETSSDLWAFGFARSTSDLWLLESEEPHFSVCSRQQDDGKFDVVEDKRPEVNPSVKKMLQDGKGFSTTGLDELSKRWYDNMKEYMTRKEKRIIKKSNGAAAKKAKV